VTIYRSLRKIFICLVAAALLLGGLYLLGAEAFLAHRVFWRIIIAGLMLTMMGGYLLWAELVAPLLGVANEKK
jgi:hypothetical protein